jgi:hypothetical protein
MKDIIDALEGKRGAARAGGGEKHHAAQHAKGKRGRCLVVTVIMVLAMPLFFIGDASSQNTVGIWSSPDGIVAVTIPNGWEHVEHMVGGRPLLAIGPSPEIARRERRGLGVCGAERRAISQADLSQEEANARVRSISNSLLIELRPSVVHVSEVIRMNGVDAISIDIEREGGRGSTRTMQKIFAVASDFGVTQYQITCSASGSAIVEEDVAAMQRFMASVIVDTGLTQ